ELHDAARYLYPEIEPELREVLEDADRPWQTGGPHSDPSSELWRFLGRWPELLRYITGGSGDHIHGLFAAFSKRRVPGLSHRFLPFLAQLIGIRLIITTTFDGLVEDALRRENVVHQVLAMDQGRHFPSAALVRETRTVIQLDRSVYGGLSGGPNDIFLD